MTARIREFLHKRADDGPCLVVDLEVVRENYLAFAKALPDTKVFYAVKANPAPEVLALGIPTMMPSVLNGNGPLKRVWKFVMSSCWSITPLLVS